MILRQHDQSINHKVDFFKNMSKKVSNEVMISYGYIMSIKFKMNERLGSYVLTNFFFNM